MFINLNSIIRGGYINECDNDTDSNINDTITIYDVKKHNDTIYETPTCNTYKRRIGGMLEYNMHNDLMGSYVNAIYKLKTKNTLNNMNNITDATDAIDMDNINDVNNLDNINDTIDSDMGSNAYDILEGIESDNASSDSELNSNSNSVELDDESTNILDSVESNDADSPSDLYADSMSIIEPKHSGGDDKLDISIYESVDNNDADASAFLRMIPEDMVIHLVQQYKLKEEYLKALMHITNTDDDIDISDSYIDVFNVSHDDEMQMRQKLIRMIQTTHKPTKNTIHPKVDDYPVFKSSMAESINIILKNKNINNETKNIIKIKRILYPHLKDIEQYYNNITKSLYEISTLLDAE